jgi:uncharacterized membrane protein (DUF2068 family)
MTDRGIFLIAIFKLVKASLLLLVATGALSLLDGRIRDAMEIRIGQLTADSHYRYLNKVASFFGLNTLKHVEIVVIGSLFYAALFGTEGIGLLMQKRWAEYFTAIVTASFIPLEVYELFRHSSIFKMVIIAINAVVVVYLVWRLRG